MIYYKPKTAKLSKIAPLWNRALSVYRRKGYQEFCNFAEDNKLDARRYDRCLVGEAWGFVDGRKWKRRQLYWSSWNGDKGEVPGTCPQCEQLSHSLMRYVLDYPMFKEIADEFKFHWRQEHAR